MSRHQGTSSFTGNRSNLKIQSSREELIHNRYNLTEPQGIYPLDSFPTSSSSNDFISHINATNNGHKYPDFQPWKHSPKEDAVAIDHLQKGYYEPPQVANELLSARNIMHQLLRSNSSLDELSSNLLKAIDVRANNNKIGPSTYKPPPRVTLTDHKRESWLKDLASCDVPLRKLARTIPHGVRNKSLLDQCVLKNIPINRAIWFVRCVGTNELRGLKRKGGANIEFTWLQEWTLQVVEYVEKLSLEYSKYESHLNQEALKSWKSKLNYILRFAANLYIENLIDKEGFKNWINRFFKHCKNYELPLALTIIKLFWFDIMKTDYLIKELTETSLLWYQKISSLKNVLDSKELTVTDLKLNEKIKNKLLQNFKDLIIKSFDQSIDNFILPNTWNQLKPTIKSILDLDDPHTLKNLNLISYRNESLMINYSLNKKGNDHTLVQVLDNVSVTYDFEKIIDLIFTENWKPNLEVVCHWGITKFRSGYHRVYLVSELFKKFKSQQVASFKDIEQEVLNIIFKLKDFLDVICLKNLFYLLNELSQSKYFKVTIYVRKLLSSGLVYLSGNDSEKLLHSSILKNLRSGNSSQSSLVLKNLDTSCDENFRSTNEENFKIGKQLVETIMENENGEGNNESFQFLNDLYVGHKLKLAESIAKDYIFKLENGSIPLSYALLQNITRLYLTFGDLKNLTLTFIKLLERDVVGLEELEFIAEYFLSYDKLIGLFSNFDVLAELFIRCFTKIEMKFIELNKLWALLSINVEDERLKLELKQITTTKEIQINNEVVQTNLLLCGADISLEDFLDSNNFHNSFQILIRLLFNNANNEFTKRSSILKLLKILKSYNNGEFNKILFVYIKKTYSSTTDLFRYEPLLDIVVSELISLDIIVDTFMNFQSPIYLSFVKDLLFRNFSEAKDYDSLKLDFLRFQYKRENPEVILLLIKDSLMEIEQRPENIHSDSTDLMSSFLPEQRSTQYRCEFLKIFVSYLVQNQNLVVKVFNIQDLESKHKFLNILNDAINSETLASSTSVTLNSDLSNLVPLIKRLNEFNLPIFQLLFKLKMDQITSDAQFVEFFSSIVRDIEGEQRFIGSLFELVDDKLKISFIHYLESLFLTSNHFPHILVGETEMALPFISDVLITLSKSLENVPLPDELVFSLDNSLEQLLNIVNKSERSSELYDAVSLFLRIIIIHKAFFIDIIVERNSIKETFLNNLVNLFTSKAISNHLQLKNLLYDLLLSIKSSVSEMNSNQTSNIKLPLSLINLPAISQNSSNIQEIYNENNSNLHDQSVLGELYLFNKSSQIYYELNAKSFDLVEDSNPVESLNDTAINLQLFGTTIERKNPT